MVKLPPDFKELLSLLHTHRDQYLLVGGYAVAAYGYPRFTGDMDVWIRTDIENAESDPGVCRDCRCGSTEKGKCLVNRSMLV